MIQWAWRFLALGLLLVPAVASRADDKDCRAIVDKAIKAVGGEQQLAKYRAQTWKETGTYYGEGAGQPFVGKYAIQYPDQFRMEIENVFVIVLNGNKGWIAMGGNTQEMTKEQLTQQKESIYAGWVAQLLPLTEQKGFQLSSLGESKIGDRAVVGIKVLHKGHNDVQLYFDKGTGLLRGCTYHYKDWMTGKDTEMTLTYDAYKEFSGIKEPTKVELKRDGKQFVEAQLEDVKPVEKLDASVFAKP